VVESQYEQLNSNKMLKTTIKNDENLNNNLSITQNTRGKMIKSFFIIDEKNKNKNKPNEKNKK